MVTNSSAAVGCSATVASKSSLVAPAVKATAKPWIISAASSPTMWQPRTRFVALSTTSFIMVRQVMPVMVWNIGRKLVR